MISRNIISSFNSIGFIRIFSRRMSTNKGYVLGIYETENKEVSLTETSKKLEDDKKFSRLSEIILLSGMTDKKNGKCRVFTGHCEDVSQVSVVSVGAKDASESHDEQIHEGRENIRTAVASGVTSLKKNGIIDIAIDPCTDAEAAAEGAYLSLFTYEELKSKKSNKVNLTCFSDNQSIKDKWNRGEILAEAQNFSRHLMEAPANILTPTKFCELAKEKFSGLDNVTLTAHDLKWAEEKKMGSFISVSRGSDEPLRFLEVHYKGDASGSDPVAIVGKGVTFDSGGISIKSSSHMDYMRADMGGAACTIASVYAAAKLKLKINVVGLMPLTENMPNGRATKPGDVVTASNSKTIQVDNTDAEGRLILADALVYSQTFKPRATIDMATLTGACIVALGSAAAATYTNSDSMFNTMQKAGIKSGDRVWRMPLFKHYSKAMNTNVPLADLNNISGNSEAGSCTAAAFLKEFVESKEWMHMDIAGVMMTSGDIEYLPKGMSGRPTRTIVEFLAASSK